MTKLEREAEHDVAASEARIRALAAEVMAALDQLQSDIENADSLEAAVALAEQAYEIACRAGEIQIMVEVKIGAAMMDVAARRR
jgi:hypothetical protein